MGGQQVRDKVKNIHKSPGREGLSISQQGMAPRPGVGMVVSHLSLAIDTVDPMPPEVNSAENDRDEGSWTEG